MSKYDGDLTLVGTVQLDERSLQDLEKVIREKVIKEYQESGILLRDVKEFIKNTDAVTLYHLLYESIDDILSEGRIVQLKSCDGEKLEKLKIIQSVINL